MLVRILRFTLVGSLIAAFVVGIAWIHRSNAHLRQEKNTLSHHNEEIVRLRAYEQAVHSMPTNELHDELSRAEAELKGLQMQAEERFDRIQARTIANASALANNRDPLTGMTRLEYFENVGQATPSAAVQTLMWAAMKENNDVLIKMLKVDGDARNEAEALMAKLPPPVREKYSGPESLIALFVAEVLVERISAAQIMSQTVEDAQHATVTVRSPSGGQEKIHMQLSPEGWQMVISTNMVEKIQARLK
jgi:hypothetical protein